MMNAKKTVRERTENINILRCLIQKREQFQHYELNFKHLLLIELIDE